MIRAFIHREQIVQKSIHHQIFNYATPVCIQDFMMYSRESPTSVGQDRAINSRAYILLSASVWLYSLMKNTECTAICK